MGGLRSYSAIATKIRAMESRLLQYEDFEKLAGMENISQAAEYLSKIPAYQSALEGQGMSFQHRRDMEQLLAGSLYYDFLKLYRFGSRPQKELLKLYFRKYEIEEIKHRLRHILNHENSSWTPIVFRESLQKFTKIHPDEMMAAKTLQDVAFALRDTDYKEILDKTGVLEKGSLFDCEMVLNLFYFTEFWKRKDKLLKKSECRFLTETFGTRVDILNMTWIYRAKKYYKASAASVYGLLIPVRYKLREGDVRKMVEAPDMESLDAAVRSTCYGNRFQGMELNELEKFYHDFLQKVYADGKRRAPYSIAVVAGYLYAKEEEIRKLTTVLEGIWYRLPKEETLAYVSSGSIPKRREV